MTFIIGSWILASEFDHYFVTTVISYNWHSLSRGVRFIIPQEASLIYKLLRFGVIPFLILQKIDMFKNLLLTCTRIEFGIIQNCSNVCPEAGSGLSFMSVSFLELIGFEIRFV